MIGPHKAGKGSGAVRPGPLVGPRPDWRIHFTSNGDNPRGEQYTDHVGWGGCPDVIDYSDVTGPSDFYNWWPTLFMILLTPVDY